MSDVHIRRATQADLNLLAELNRDVQQIHADAHPGLFKQPDNTAEVIADFEMRILADADGLVIILEADQEAVGYIYAREVTRPENAYTHARKYMLVDQITVKPAFQKHGYGQRLMQAIRDEAAARGIHQLMLGVYTFNAMAEQFYIRLGFERLFVQMALNIQ